MESLQVNSFKGNGQGFLCLLLLVLHGCIVFVQSSDEVSSQPSPKEMLKTSIPWEVLSGHYLPSSRLTTSDVPLSSFAPPRITVKGRTGDHKVSSSDGDSVLKTPQKGEEPKPVHNVARQGEELETVLTVTRKESELEPVFTVTRQEDKSEPTLTRQEDQTELVLAVTRQEDKSEQTLTRQNYEPEPAVTWQELAFNITRQGNEPEQTFNVHRQEDEPEVELTVTRPHKPVPDSDVSFTSPRSDEKTTGGLSVHSDIISVYSEQNETTTASTRNHVTSATPSSENTSLAGTLQSQVGRITFKLEETTLLLSTQNDKRPLALRYEETALVSSTTYSTTSVPLNGSLASHTATLQEDKVLTLSQDMIRSTHSQPNDDDTSKEISLASVPDEGGLLEMLARNASSPTPSLTVQLAKNAQAIKNDSSKIETMVEKIDDFNDTKDDKLLLSKKKASTSSGREEDGTQLTENPPPIRSFTVSLKHTTYDLSTGSSIPPLKKNRNLIKVATRPDDVFLEKEDVYPFLRSQDTTKSSGLFSSLSGLDRTETKRVTSLPENSKEGKEEVSRKVGNLSTSPMNRSVEGGSVSLVTENVTSASPALPEFSEEIVLVETAKLKELEEWKLANSSDFFPATSDNQQRSETTATGATHDTDHLDTQSVKDTRVLKTTTVSMEVNHIVNVKDDQIAGDDGDKKGDGMADRTTESGCLYDVYGRFGTLRLPQTEQYMGYAVGDLVTCRWRIQIPSGPNIKVSFEKFSLFLGVEYLEIVVGMDGELRRRRISGSKLPKDIITMGTQLWMTLRVRNDNIEDKVIITFEESEAAAMFPEISNYTCGAIITDMTGSIASPGYPHTNYSNLQECSWYLIAPPHSVIRLKVEQFSTDEYDHLTIGRGLHAADVSSQLFTFYGHRQEEKVLVVSVNTMWIHFEADDSDTDTGFSISFETVPRDICNTSNIMTSLEGTVTSVGYPGPYPINSQCTWYIRGPEKARVILTFHDLSVHEGRDFVLVGEGRNAFDGPFRTFSGQHTDTDGEIDMEASNVWIHFTSDHTEDDPPCKGFNMSYRIILPEHLLKNMSDIHYPEEEEATYTPGGSLEKEEEEVHMITVLLTNVGVEQLEKQKEEFEDKVAKILNGRCGDLHDSACPPSQQIRSDDVRVVSSHQQGRHLVVLLSVATDGDLSAAVMAASDYEELETLFHTDLQSLDLQNEDSEEAAAAHLPEWLIGVIVVVILLIIAFFAMVIYSLMKERKKSRAGSYGGTTTSASICEDVEVGKSDGAIRITAFSLEQDKDSGVGNGHSKNGSNGTGWTLDSEAAATLQRREPGVSGCMNPAFIDDDEDEDNADKDNAKCESVEKDKESGKTKVSKKNKEAKNQKGSSKTSKSPKNAKTPKSPKGSKSPKSAKNEKNSIKDADKSAASEEAPEESCKENGDISKGVEDPVSAVHGGDHETTDIGQTPAQAECHKDESQDTAVQKEKTSAGPEGEAGKETSDEDVEKGKVEVVVDHELPPRDLQDGLVLHIEDSGESGDRETSPESSTDDKENHSDLSTNL